MKWKADFHLCDIIDLIWPQMTFHNWPIRAWPVLKFLEWNISNFDTSFVDNIPI